MFVCNFGKYVLIYWFQMLVCNIFYVNLYFFVLFIGLLYIINKKFEYIGIYSKFMIFFCICYKNLYSVFSFNSGYYWKYYCMVDEFFSYRIDYQEEENSMNIDLV